MLQLSSARRRARSVETDLEEEKIASREAAAIVFSILNISSASLLAGAAFLLIKHTRDWRTSHILELNAKKEKKKRGPCLRECADAFESVVAADFFFSLGFSEKTHTPAVVLSTSTQKLTLTPP